MKNNSGIIEQFLINEAVMLMNGNIIYSEIMKMICRVLMMNLKRKTEPGCDSHDFSIRVLYLDLFCTSNMAIWNRKYTC